MRILAILSLSLSLLALGCGRSAPEAPRGSGPPEQEAARIFGLAQDLEKGRKIKEAFAAYHLIARKFPETPHGKRAAEHIRKAQQKRFPKTR